jgi:hypothetical protein
MTSTRTLTLALTLLAATAALAGGLSRESKEWPNSPQGYFMTNAEKAIWSATVKNDADAEKFISDFLSRRAPGFPAEVAAAAAQADKFLTVGGTPGSKTLRGKTVIVLGPPASMSVKQKKLPVDRRMTAGGAAAAGGGGGGPAGASGGFGGPSVEQVASVAASEGMTGGGVVNEYTFNYSGEAIPAPVGRPFEVKLEVSLGGSDQIRDRKLAAELDEMFEKVAQSKIVAPAGAAVTH